MIKHKGVRFGSEVTDSPSKIAVEQASTDTIRVHLGFLKINHKYRIEVTLPIPYNGLKPIYRDSENNCIVESMTPVSTGTVFVINLCVKNRVVEEALQFGTGVYVLLTATVLDMDQGTPVLKDGIHLLAKEMEDDG